MNARRAEGQRRGLSPRALSPRRLVFAIVLAILGCGASTGEDAATRRGVTAAAVSPKLDMELGAILQKKAAERQDATTAGDASRADFIDRAPIELEVVVDGDITPLIAAGLPLPETRERTIRASLSPVQIRTLVTFPQVIAVRRPQPIFIR